MKRPAILSLLVFLLSTGICAQGLVAPPKLSKFAKDPLFNAPNVPGKTFSQIHIIPYPGKPGKYIVGMTVNSGLPGSWGGKGGSDLLTGVYDIRTNKFTPDKKAAALNSSRSEFGLTLHHSGLLAYFESSRSGKYTGYLAKRKSLDEPFTIAGPIAGLPRQSYWDGSLADLGGKLHLVHVYKRDIAVSPLDPAKPALTGKPKIVVRTPVPGKDANSPTPIVDSTGELIALSHHVNVNANDHWVSFDLDPATPALPFITIKDWINNGGYIAGTFYDAHSAVSGYRISSVRTAWLAGGAALPGKKMEVAAYIPVQGVHPVPWAFSFLLLSTNFRKSPFSIPGVTGKFGLDTAFLAAFSLGVHDPLSGKAYTYIPVPNDPALRGTAVPAQSLCVEPGRGMLILTNTAALTVR